jgi:quinol monooxygenase YgiN
MVTVALLVRLEAKPGKEVEVENFLRGGLAVVQDEPATVAWFGIRLGPTTFGIFDAFPDEGGRQAHLTGRVAAALMAQAPDLFASPPVIEKVEVLAAKLPGETSQTDAGSRQPGEHEEENPLRGIPLGVPGTPVP